MFVPPMSKGFRVTPRVIGKEKIMPVVAVDRLLLETADFILLETNDRILLR